jgi:hypothetical protein
MAPEVCKGQKCTPAGDVYALGIIVWACATDRVPWEGTQLPAILHQVVNNKKRPKISTEPGQGSVFNAAQWRFLMADLISPKTGQFDPMTGLPADFPGGCWAHEPADRPTLVDIDGMFKENAFLFPAPVNHSLLAAVAAVEAKVDAVGLGVLKLVAHTQFINGALSALISGEGVKCFRLFWIVPPAPPSRVKDRAAALSPTKWFAKDVLLVPLDELDLQPIQCGPDGNGFPLKLPKQFFKDHAAAIKLSYKLLKYALKAGKLAGLPLPQLAGESAGAMGELLDSVCAAAAEKLPDAVNTALDAATDAVATSKAAGGVRTMGQVKTTKTTGESYRKLTALMDKKYPRWCESMGDAGPCTSDDGRVGWVRAENVAVWKASRA